MNLFKKCFVTAAIVILYPICVSSELRGLDGSVLVKIEDRSVIALWPQGTTNINPDIPEKSKPCGKRFFNIHNPNMVLYKPRNTNGVAVVLCPGGGYAYVASGIEGDPVAEKLNESGLTVFVLKYRLPNTVGVCFKHPIPLSDALRALQLVRHHAVEFNIDPDKIGIMGFSAGGHLASTAGTLFSKYTFGNDKISKISSRPDFMCLVYPVISSREEIAHDCLRFLVGDKSEKQSLVCLSNELNVTKKTPPTFIVHAKDDRGVNPQNSILMYESLKTMDIPAELKLYEKGGHGFGVGHQGTDSEIWIDDFVNWLSRMNFISTKGNDNEPNATER